MILLITKYHRTANGETASSEKIEKADETECVRKAFEKASEYEHNYYADTSVLDFTVTVFNPKTVNIVKYCDYTTPTVEPETTEQPEPMEN